jgi:hypothetical protein
MTILILGLYTYVCLMILQLALFNFIMFGVMMVYGRKVYLFFHAIEYRYDYDSKNFNFRTFIEQENVRVYRSKNIELVGGEMGKWLELQLPEDIEEQESK